MNSVSIHAVLALAGLAFAYQTYTREAEQEEQPGQVTLLECDPKNVSKLELESATQLLSVHPKKNGDTIEYWLTTQRRKKPEEKKPEEKKPEESKAEAKPGDAGVKAEVAAKTEKPADKPAEPLKPPPDLEKSPRANDPDAPVTFLGNQKFSETVKQLAPMRAMRALGDIPKERFDQFGFDKVESRFRVECGGRKVELELGARTFGAGDRYSRDPKTKQSYLLSGQLLTDLESARYKFMQNDLNAFELTEVDQATVKALGKERKLMHRNRTSAQDARWVDAAAPDKRNELFNTWFQRLSRLKARTYLNEGAEPGSDLQVEASGSSPVVTIEYGLEGKPKGKLEIVRVDTKKEPLFYARTETTRRWVSVYDSLAKQVEDDVAMVVGAEEIPPEKEAKDKPAAPDKAALPPGHPAL